MELLGGDADLRAQTEFPAVGKTGGGVDVHGRRVHFPQEFFGGLLVFRHDTFAVAGAVGGNIVDGFRCAGYHAHGEDIVVVFPAPVRF